jgi:hypothetical protein
MGTSRPRAPINEHADPLDLDDGTLMRTESAPPGTIGLKGGSAKDGGAGTDPVSYARARFGRRVDNGECFTLVDRALRASGLRSAGDYGTITSDADYVWGTLVTLSDVRAGDIIQFRDYRFDRRVDTESAAGSEFQEESQERPHHTAIVERVNGSEIMVLEQNVPRGTGVSRVTLYFASSTSSNGRRTTTITVQGQFWFYRPQSR